MPAWTPPKTQPTTIGLWCFRCTRSMRVSALAATQAFGNGSGCAHPRTGQA
jgi:hypothetical protein